MENSNRVIKFRAWDIVNFKMILPFDLFTFRVRFAPAGTGYICYPDTDAVFMQFTGLKDKNGKEIYEGDIVAIKFNHHYVDRVEWKGKPDAVGEVYWDFGGFRLNCRGTKDRRYADFWDFVADEEDGYTLVDMNLKHTKIIGNIYENPELLIDK